MKYNTSALLILFLTASLTINFNLVETQDDHFIHIHVHSYVLTILYSSEKHPKIVEQLENTLTIVENSSALRNKRVIFELIDTFSLPYFDTHYSLMGRDAARLFIQGQIIDLEDFNIALNKLYLKQITSNKLGIIISEFVANRLNSISIELTNIQDYRNLILSKRIIGFYAGSKGINFERYFHVARKNIDFTFVHTFDPELKTAIYTELGHPVPDIDILVIIRHSENLNYHDDQILTFNSNFDEKALFTFIEFEKFDKLREPEQGNEIFNKFIHFFEPMVVFVKESVDETWEFQNYKAAVKMLPKTLIYTHVDIYSKYLGPYHQLFTMASKMIKSDTITIFWPTPYRSIKAVQYNGDFGYVSIHDFIKKTIQDNEKEWEISRSHLFDYKPSSSEDEIAVIEL